MFLIFTFDVDDFVDNESTTVLNDSICKINQVIF